MPIRSVKVEDAVNLISNEDYGIHCMVIYPDLLTLREFYSYYIQKQIEEKKEIVQLGPFYETEESARQILSTGPVAMDVSKLQKDGSLLIVDSAKVYSPSSSSRQSMDSDFRFKDGMVKLAKKTGRKGFSILGDIGAFPFKGLTDELIRYEASIPKRYDIDLKGLCLYHKNDFGRLTAQQRKKLFESHEMVIQIEPY